ncbi:hypothetical protein ACFQ1S_09870 [Kibdelosporangium lantanae]|uniref:Uncharacterized protein n=1 Tax=Kibdelosporangium lantanae TaxID=1497396 RepID=A0ABW3M5E9_9PSEU
MTYLLSPLAENVTGQIIRFAGGSLHIVRQAFESLVLEDSPTARWSL